MAHLLWQDYVVFVGFLLVSLCIGLYHGLSGGKQSTTKEFLVGNRRLSVIPTMISLMVSFQSAIMFLGFVAEMSTFGYLLWPGYCICIGLCQVITERLIVPVLYPLKLTSIYEYLDLRFHSDALRLLASSFGILLAIIYMAMAMYAPCMALYYLSGFPLSVTVPLMSIVCIGYTSFGGMKAVIWTDVFQFFVMFSGMIVIVIKGTYDVGGLGHVMNTTSVHGRFTDLPMTLDPRERHSFWSILVGFTMFWIASYGMSQASVQRYCSTATMKESRRVVLLVIPSVFLMSSLVCYSGLVVFTHFTDSGCDPIASGHISSATLLYPVYIVQVFNKYRGFTGLFMAMLYGGALSSISSSLSGTSANTWEDILKPRLPKLSEKNAAFITKAIVVFYGCIAVILVYILDQLPGTLIKITVQLMGAISSPIFGVFVLGMCFRRAEYIGSIVGSVCGFCSVMVICVGSMFVQSFSSPLASTGVYNCPAHNVTATSAMAGVASSKPMASGFSHLFTISYMWYLPVGSCITVIVGLIVSQFINWRHGDHNFDDLPDTLFVNFWRAFDFTNNTNADEGEVKIRDNEFDITISSEVVKGAGEQQEHMIIKIKPNGTLDHVGDRRRSSVTKLARDTDEPYDP